MQAIKSNATQRAGCLLLSALLAFPTFALAQDAPAPPAPPSDSQIAPAPPPAPTGGWKRVGDQSAQSQTSSDSNSQQPPAPPSSVSAPAPPQGDVNGNAQPATQPNGYPAYGQPTYGAPNQGGYNQAPPPQGYPQQQQPNYQQQYSQPVPPALTMAAGTYLTVRINQLLSSDRNQAGDPFSATLSKPLVINGVVVAEPGETVGGHVVEAVKAGHVTGLARLGVQLDDLALVDGQQLPIRSSLVNRTGPSSVGQDAGTIAGTTALGAAVGAAAAWGKGAAIGAGSGAVLGIVGVLVTRGHPSILYPEQTLTFRVETPVTIETGRAPQAFHYVEPGEYSQPAYGQQPGYGPYTSSAPYPPYPPVAVAPAPYYYGSPYPYYGYGYGYGYPYYGGSGFSLFLGGRYYGGYGYRGGYYGGRYGAPIGRYSGGVGRVGGGGVAHGSRGGGSRR
jgi:hypothetical protein